MKKSLTFFYFLLTVLLAEAQTYVLTKKQDFGFGSIFDMKGGKIITGNPGSGYSNVLENGQTKIFNPPIYGYQKDPYGKWNPTGRGDNQDGNSFETNGREGVISTDRIFENDKGCIAYASGQCLRVTNEYPIAEYTAPKNAKVAIGDSVLLAMYDYNLNTEFEAKRVVLFKKGTDGIWVFDRFFDAEGMNSAAPLSIDRNYAIIGLPDYNTSTCGVKILSLSNPLKDTVIQDPNNLPNKRFGSIIKTKGNQVVVNGAEGPSFRSVLYVLESDELGNWSLKQTLTSPDTSLDGGFGSFSMDGTRLIAATPSSNGGKGAAHVFKKGNDGLYSLSQTIVNDTLDEHGSFGWNVGISGPSIAITSAKGLFFFQIPSAEMRLKRGSETILSALGNQYFGDQSVGTQSDPITFTILNSGQDTLVLGGTQKVSVSGENASEFFVNTAGLASKIPPNGHSNFTVTFAPTSLGLYKYSEKKAVISISNNDYEESTYTFTVNGYTMIGPDLKVKQGSTTILQNSTYDFGPVALGSYSPAIAFAIRNTGSDTLWLPYSPRISFMQGTQDHPDFEVYQAGVAPFVLPGGYTTFTIRFRPQSVGSLQGLIMMRSNDFDETDFAFYIIGNGTNTPNKREEDTHSPSSSFSEGVNVLPNPANDKVVVNLSSNLTATVTVRDVLGKVLLEKSGENEIILDVDHFEPGILFLEIVQGENRTVKRVIKN
jgi:hypothetical protein